MAEYNRKDRLYTKAKDEGYRSRAAYKLLELQGKYKFLRNGATVLDLGCFPGGWCQVATQSGARVIGVDLREVPELGVKGVEIIHGDASDPSVQQEILRRAGKRFDVVLSDMSPQLSGVVARDNVQTAQLVDLAFQISVQMLKTGGTLVAKAFPSADIEEVIKQNKSHFGKVQRAHLQSTRNTSNEFYLIATQLKPPAKTREIVTGG